MQPNVKIARDLRAAVMSALDVSLRPTGLAEKPKLKPKQAAGVPGAVIHRTIENPIRGETIERVLEGGIAVLFATGPGLTEEVVATVLKARHRKKLYLFGCNDAYKILPTLDVHYACDAGWWNIHYQDLHEYPLTHGMWTQEPKLSKNKYPKLRRIAGCSGNGLSVAQDLIHFGNNSGYQLINLALLFGIKRFILCGYDMSVHSGKRHFFGDHPPGLNKSGNYSGFVPMFDTIKSAALGIEILNTTPKSALKAFPKMDLEEALNLE